MRPTLLDKSEVAPMLGKTIAGLNWMLVNGTAPKSALIGGRRFWRESDVIDWINAQFEEAS